MNESYTIKDLISLFLGKIWAIILCTILGAAGAFCFSKFVMPLQYSSHISMYIQSYNISENNNENNYNNISNAKQLINTYIEVMKDDAVMKAIGSNLLKKFNEDALQKSFNFENGTISASSLRNCISISSVTDTSAIKISVTTTNAEISAFICNDLAKVAPKYLQDAIGVGSISTIDTAQVYQNPVAPNIPKNTLLGAAIGCILMMGIILVIDFFDNTIKNSELLTSKYQKAVIGEIQQFGSQKKRKKEEDRSHMKLTEKNIPFHIIESYKSIRTNIMFALATSENKIFAVSSPNPSEGKSTVSSNIAITLAQGENKVLLIDADLRKPIQHKIFEIENKKGLSTAISKMHSLEECIQKNVMKNLDILPSGSIPPNPSELLASDSMTEILKTLSGQYSVIIIDTPPVNVVTDAMELSKNVAGLLMVISYGSTTSEDIENVMKKIEISNMNLLGFILNKIQSKSGGGYYSKYKYDYKYKKYGYGYGYGYQADISKNSIDKIPESNGIEKNSKNEQSERET